MAEDRPTVTVQRFSLVAGRMTYDMEGEFVRFSDHEKALRAERQLANYQVEQVERQRREAGPVLPPELHPARRKLFEAVRELRELGWNDGDIIFGAELEPCEPANLIPWEEHHD